MLLGKRYVLSMLFLLMGVVAFAQDDTEDSDYPYPHPRDAEYKDYVKDKFHEQQDKFVDRKFSHPAPPKHMWELGLDIGPLHVSGDVKTKSWLPGWGFGGHIRKALGYAFSIRGNFMMGTTYGRNWQGSQGWSGDANLSGTLAGAGGWVPNAALGGGSTDLFNQYAAFNDEFNDVPDYRGVNNNVVFHNYRTQIRELSLSGVVNLNNLKFHKKRNKLSVHGIFGIGGLWYNTTMDQLDAEGAEYDYSRITQNYGMDSVRNSVKDDLDALWDGTYESQAERHWDDYKFFGAINNNNSKWSYRPTAHVGMGLQYKITNRINVGLESKVTYTNDDLLDGQRWQEWGALSRDYDTYVFTNASLNINLGGKNSVEPLWWMSPIDYAYQELDDAPCCDNLPEIPDMTDTDGDGVPDLFDEEADSRKDCPVDTRGRMLDSDGDGHLDCDDCQPHTPAHLREQAAAHECGEAFEECCKETVYIEPVKNCEDAMLPSILFDNNRYGVKEQFGSQLQAVANYLMSEPSATLCVVGHTDNRSGSEYNNVLSWKRANEVVNELVTNYGVPRSRLRIQYGGEDQPVIGGLSSTAGKKGVDAQFALNRRVNFKCCMDGQFDMPKPSGPDAGRR